ncbi:MAG: 16S rRNA (adenine(1518)-N(6)/adenine(1519)-N(6))-dimethyltransferase RsmA [Verrucomicrobiota bacterium]|nr:16S rRNA (adenine(1518)-N(6)/adenine(1519)-N(6))-dimethyltransferase RsmA [Verrucomicrobiota bacterium]
MKLSEIRNILREEDIQLTKSLGQNFLHDHHQLRKIVALAQVEAGDKILEIGPGLGPLTDPLLQAAAQVTAIEKDHRLIDLLKQRFGNRDNFSLKHGDALRLIRKSEQDWTQYKLVANLPYSIASPLMVDLAWAKNRPRAMIVTLQLEVARRLMAKSGTKQYGVLTLLIGLHYSTGESFEIPRGSFFPEPNVDSCCIQLLRRESPMLTSTEADIFKRIIKRGFSERRKKLMKLLKHDWPAEAVITAFESLGLDEKVRGEKVSLEQFVEMTKLLNQTL